jgi:hypothetical protein
MATKRRHRVGKGKKAKVPSKIANTIAHLKALQAARAAGYPVSYTTDPAWLLDEAINRRAGWVEDPHTRGTTQPIRGKLPRKATGQWQDDYSRMAHRVNSRVIVRPSEVGPARKELLARMPERFTYPEDE